jgi:hypothetical protein
VTLTALPEAVSGVNTRTALWPDRWPAIALQECIDLVEAAPPEKRAEVKFGLPCAECDQKTRCLNAKRKELGPLLYDREILTRPRSSESSLFPMELFEPMLDGQQALVRNWRPPFSWEHHFAVAQGWDLAWSEKIGGDYLVCMTGVIDRRNGQKQMLDIERWQRVSFDDQVKLMAAKWALFGADLVVIESDAAQVIWAKHVGRNTAVPVLPHAAGGKGDFATGVPGLLITLENKKWTFPYARGTYHREEMDNFLAEAEAFGWVDGKLQGVGEHDDTVMAWWHLDWALNRLVLEAPRTQRRGNQPGKYI